jgi:hypothetical protein
MRTGSPAATGHREPVILLRKEALERRFHELHAHSYQAKGDLLGLSKWAVLRRMTGETTAGEMFIARVLVLFATAEGRKPGQERFGELFDELFQVTTTPAEMAA